MNLSPTDFDVSMWALSDIYKNEYRHLSTTGEVISRHQLRKENITKLYHIFNWNYIISQSVSTGDNTEEKAILIVSFFYTGETLDKNLEYLRNVPSYIDILIIAKNRNVYKDVKEYVKINALSWTIIEARQNRGRDISALLVESKPYIEQYDIVGFIHDKHTSGGNGDKSIGDDYNDILFENIIGHGCYIDNVLNLFESNELLGLVAPPKPLHGDYFGMIGGEWSNDYENTINLADRLGLDIPMDEEHQPFILGTAFWCRRKALDKLLDYPWKYDDFPDEPLDMDGTLNHAIERIFPYVCQDAGYYSGIVMNDRFASLYMNNLEIMLSHVLSICHQNYLFTRYSQLGKDDGKALKEFCRGKEKIYIFGTGGNASRLMPFLKANKIDVTGFIVSNGHRDKSEYNGKPVYELSELEDSDLQHSGVIVSVNRKLQEIIAKDIYNAGFTELYCM